MFYNQRINSFEHPLICQQVNQDEFLKELPISLCSGFANYNKILIMVVVGEGEKGATVKRF